MKKTLFLILAICIFVIPISANADLGPLPWKGPIDNVVKGSNVQYSFKSHKDNFKVIIKYDPEALEYVNARHDTGAWMDVSASAEVKANNNNGVLTLIVSYYRNFEQSDTIDVVFKTLKTGKTTLNASMINNDNINIYVDGDIVLTVSEPTCPKEAECPKCSTCENSNNDKNNEETKECEKCEVCKECIEEKNETPLTTWISYGANVFSLVVMAFMFGMLNKKPTF